MKMKVIKYYLPGSNHDYILIGRFPQEPDVDEPLTKEDLVDKAEYDYGKE